MKLKRILIVLSSFVISIPSLAQYGQNLDFEDYDKRSKTFSGWTTSTNRQYIGLTNLGYTVSPDSHTKVKGRYALRIEADSNATSHTFGSAMYIISTSFEGKRIQLKGFIKTQDVDTSGYAGLWMRLDGASGMIAFDNMENRPIKGTNDWKEYTIDLPLSGNTRRILLGGLLDAPSGKVWIDNLTLLIDGVEVSKAKIKEPKVLREPSNEFSNGSGIEITQLTPQRLKDLILLGKVWGFLKYHHPAIAEARYNWDSELFKIMPSYLSVHDSIARDQLLIDWIAKLGPVSNCSDCNDDRKVEVKQKPDVSWIDRTSPSLQVTLNYILNNRNLSDNYYVSIGRSGPLFLESPYSQFRYPDDGYRILALFRYWNIIQYYFPYKYAIGEDWNAMLPQFLPKVIQAENAVQYRLAMLELIGNIHDTHANLWGRDTVMINYKGQYIAPIKTRFVQDKLVVSDISAAEPEIRIGDIITTIDQIPVDEYIKNNSKYFPASNLDAQRRNISRDILRTKNRTLDLTIQNDKGTSQIKIATIHMDDYDHSGGDYAWSSAENCCYLLNPDVGYINLGSIKASLLPDAFKSFTSTKGIIVDIRNYPNETVVNELTNYLTDNAKPFVRFSFPDAGRPGQFLMRPGIDVGKPNKDPYKGKVIVLVNELTQSNAEFTTMALQTSPNVTVIGSTTAGADGDIARITLPGNLLTMISGLGVYYPDGRETQRIGIIPDIVVKPTIQGIRENRDELLEKAQSIILR